VTDCASGCAALVPTIAEPRVVIREGNQNDPPATEISLTVEERHALEAMAGSRKTEARMRERARIALLAAAGLPSRAIARKVGCTPGTASKWRVRYARDRMAGLSKTGERGAAPKYGPEHDRLILAMLDQPPPQGYANWIAPVVVARTGGHPRTIYLALPAGPENRSVRPQAMVRKHGPGVRCKGRRHRRPLHDAAG